MPGSSSSSSGIAEDIPDVSKIDNESLNPNDYSLDQLLRMIRLERSQGLNKEYKSALNKLRMGQLKVSFMTDLRRYINLSKNKDGKFDASKQEFQDLIAKSKEKYDTLSQDLINAGEKPESIENFGDLLAEMGIVEGKNSYDADQTKALLESIKMTIDQLSPLNEMYMQTVTRIEGEINETYQMLMGIHKPVNNAIIAMAKAAKGA